MDWIFCNLFKFKLIFCNCHTLDNQLYHNITAYYCYHWYLTFNVNKIKQLQLFSSIYCNHLVILTKGVLSINLENYILITYLLWMYSFSIKLLNVFKNVAIYFNKYSSVSKQGSFSAVLQAEVVKKKNFKTPRLAASFYIRWNNCAEAAILNWVDSKSEIVVDVHLLITNLSSYNVVCHHRCVNGWMSEVLSALASVWTW